jgi:creatinine amidohydrolase
MRIADMNWMQVEKYLENDNRCVLPVGSVEQHAQLSLCVDAILSERVAIEAAEPLQVPVYPCMPFGLAPYFSAFPGSISLRVETLVAVFRDLVASVYRSGFRRVLIVNGHGGNAPVAAAARELMAEFPNLSIRYHPWWAGPEVAEAMRQIDPVGSHASWVENFPWTRLTNAPAPEGKKAMVDHDEIDIASPDAVKAMLGDGNFGGEWQKPDDLMMEIWRVGVKETRALLEGPWPDLAS